MAKKPSKLGRPPASSSAETRGRIIDVARKCFAEVGYEATTNRALANEAKITTGAIYHYFESKLDIFRAVNTEAQTRVYVRFRTVVAEQDTFIGKLEAVLEAAHELNCEDPTLARFLGASRIDRQRIPELSEAFGNTEHRGFFNEMVDFGIKSGEIDPKSRKQVIAVISTVTTGLTDAVSADLVTHRLAVDGVKALLEGGLLTAPKKKR